MRFTVDGSRSYQGGNDQFVSFTVGDCLPGDRLACGTDVGVCEQGYYVCGTDGQWDMSVCVGKVVAAESPEVTCNGLDDDCDGVVDEGCDDDDDRYVESGLTCVNNFTSRDGTAGIPCAGHTGDCDDGNAAVHPSAQEVCDGLDDDCDGLSELNGSNVDVDPSLVPLLSSQFGVCAGYNQTCEDVGGSWSFVDDFGVVPNYVPDEDATFASGLCDGFDNDCDNYVDESSSERHCFGTPGFDCEGLLNCSSYFVATGDCVSGCSLVPGRCSDTGVLCDVAHPCATGTCVGLSCDGFVSCEGFASGDCGASKYGGYGCSLKGCDSYIARDLFSGVAPPTTCSDVAGCVWDCGGAPVVEICSNGVDDDDDNGDGIVNGPGDLVDCEDPDCQNGGTFTWTDAEAHSGAFSCLGTNQTGDKLGLSDYCANNVDADVGLWFSDDGCLDSSVPSACCEVVQYGTKKYYSDVGNVKVY